MPTASVDWLPGQVALESMSDNLIRFHAQFSTGHIASGRVMHRRDPRLADTCPRCNAPNETTTHIVCCPASRLEWHRLVDQLHFHLDQVHTAPAILMAIIDALLGFHHGERNITPRGSPALQAAIQGDRVA